jgi:hypothetical protein
LEKTARISMRPSSAAGYLLRDWLFFARKIRKSLPGAFAALEGKAKTITKGLR